MRRKHGLADFFFGLFVLGTFVLGAGVVAGVVYRLLRAGFNFVMGI